MTSRLRILYLYSRFAGLSTWSRSIKTQKKKIRCQYPAIVTKQVWSIKDLRYGQIVFLPGNKTDSSRAGKMGLLAHYTLYSKMAAILVFFCLMVNCPFWLRSRLNILLNCTFESEAKRGSLQGNKRTLKWRLF